MIAALIKYRWLIVGAASILAIGGAWVHGYNKGVKHERIKIVEKRVEVLEKRSAIANKRPDRSGVVKRLREGTF